MADKLTPTGGATIGSSLSSARPVTVATLDTVPPPRKPQYFPQQADYYRFYSPVTGHAFYCLRGDQAPTVTGGYGKWNILDRPRRTGLTVFSGYDPITIDIPVRFEAYLGERSGFDIENDVQTLEFLGGRGVSPAANTQKDKTPPYVAIASFGADGETIYVLGKNYTFDDDDNPAPPHWVITGIAWDGDVLFNSLGRRVRQTATISLTQYVVPAAGKFGTKRAKGVTTVTRHATARLNTMAKLSKAWGNTKADVRKLNTSKHLAPYVRNFSKRMKPGTPVKLYVK